MSARKARWSLRWIEGRSYAVLFDELPVGEVVLHRSGYADWLFGVDDPRPSATTCRRLLAQIDVAEAERGEVQP